MSATIFTHEFRFRLRSILIWSLSVSAMTLFFFSIFPTFASQADVINKMLENFPPALLEAFGMSKTNLATVMGFYSFVFAFIQLCTAIQAGNYGFGLVSVEESEWTADFLLSKPVSRFQVLTSKLLGALASLLATDVVIWVVSFIGILSFNDGRTYDAGLLVQLMLSLVLFQLFFLSLGLAISLLVKRVRSVTPYSLGLGFAAYVLNGFSGLFGEVKLEYLTPFKHLDPAYFVEHGAFNTPLLILNVAITVVALAAGYWLYLRRDIPAVS
jgi:beta-exotoxin I transport system permease protein